MRSNTTADQDTVLQAVEDARRILREYILPARKTGQRGTGQRLRINQEALMSWAECLLNVTLVAFVIYAAIRFLLLWIFPKDT